MRFSSLGRRSTWPGGSRTTTGHILCVYHGWLLVCANSLNHNHSVVRSSYIIHRFKANKWRQSARNDWKTVHTHTRWRQSPNRRCARILKVFMIRIAVAQRYRQMWGGQEGGEVYVLMYAQHTAMWVNLTQNHKCVRRI